MVDILVLGLSLHTRFVQVQRPKADPPRTLRARGETMAESPPTLRAGAETKADSPRTLWASGETILHVRFGRVGKP